MLALSRRPQQSSPSRCLQSPRQKQGVLKTLIQRLKGSPPAYILVMGSTGTGKSTFINLVSGSKLGVGLGLESKTEMVQPTNPFRFGHERVIMVDTPGFDDTTKSDSEVLRTISKYLVDLHRKGIRIRGIVYMHRITDNRMGGTALRNFRMFHAICGSSAMKNAVIVLNMWNEAKRVVYEQREKELRDVFFQNALADGACIMRHDGNRLSAERILESLVERPSVELRLQVEMVDKNVALHATEAGLALLGDLAGRELKHNDELRRVRGELEEARLRRDAADEGDLRVTVERLEILRCQLEEEQDKLRRSAAARLGVVTISQRAQEFFGTLRKLLGAPKSEV